MTALRCLPNACHHPVDTCAARAALPACFLTSHVALFPAPSAVVWYGVTLVCFLFWQQLMELDNQYVSELKNMQADLSRNEADDKKKRNIEKLKATFNQGGRQCVLGRVSDLCKVAVRALAAPAPSASPAHPCCVRPISSCVQGRAH